jgi:hypothetical protein
MNYLKSYNMNDRPMMWSKRVVEEVNDAMEAGKYFAVRAESLDGEPKNEEAKCFKVYSLTEEQLKAYKRHGGVFEFTLFIRIFDSPLELL